MNILIIDTRGMELYARMLKKLECEVVSCSSANLTLNILGKFSPDLLIMDLDLADIDGLVMLGRLKKQNPATLILVMVEDYDKLESALAIGIDEYMIKPVEEKEFLARVKKAMKQQTQEKKLSQGRYNPDLVEPKTMPVWGDGKAPDKTEEGGLMEILRRVSSPHQYVSPDHQSYPESEKAGAPAAKETGLPADRRSDSIFPHTPAEIFKNMLRPQPEPLAEPQPETAPEPKTGPVSELQAEATREPEPEPVSEPQPEAVPEIEPVSPPGLNLEPGIAPKPEKKLEPAPALRAVPRPQIYSFPTEAVSSVETAGGSADGLKDPGKTEKVAGWKKASSKGDKPFVKAFKTLGNFFLIGTLILMATMAFFLVQSKLAGGVPSVAGYQMYVVLSGSMNPAFDTGSLAFVRPINPREIRVGDIITFKGASGSAILTTHRVVEINNHDGLTFTTRGDANNVNDPNPVSAANVVGKVHGAVPYIGYLMGFAQTKNGLIVLVFVPGLLVIVSEVRNLFKYMGEMDKEKKKKKDGDKLADLEAIEERLAAILQAYPETGDRAKVLEKAMKGRAK